MTRLIRFAVVSAVLLVAGTAHAQDSLRVLRVQPASPAAPTDPLVIVFDHPVAPRLDQSVDPASVLRIVPAVGARVYWRDPSTIVADFDSPWPSGARYEVRIDAGLRSAGGLSLEKRPPIVVTVRMPRLLGVFVDANESEADTIAHPVAVFESAFDLSAIAGRAWFVPQLDCGITDSLTMTPVRVRRISDSLDSWAVREAGSYDRNRRLDSVRRVVEFDIPATLARGCRGELRLPQVVGQPLMHRALLIVRAPFRFDSSACPRDRTVPIHLDEADPSRPRCDRGPITLRFTNPVTAAEVRANVLVDDRPARVNDDATSSSITLLDSIHPRRITSVTIRSTLRSSRGEPLGRDTTVVISGNPIAPSVGYATGQVLVPRDAPSLLRVRHVNTDSVIVVIGRVPDSLRSRALGHGDSYYYSRQRWEALVRDTVARVMKTPAPVDSERVVDIPMSWIPVAWRADPLLFVRVMPREKSMWSAQQGDAKPDRARRERVAIVVHAVNAELTSPRFAVVRRSNIAASVQGTSDNADVWVTSLRSAQSRAGAIVRVLDDSMHVYARAVTDAGGRARLRYARPRSVSVPLHIEVADGSDRALLMLSASPVARLVDEDSLDGQWWFGATKKLDDRWIHGSAFTERGIYRPGERVYLGGAVRTFTAGSGYRIPATDSARWTIWYQNRDGRAERVWSHVGRLSDFGTLADSFSLDRTTRLGEYAASLALRAQGGWRTASRVVFRVAEYRAPEFAVRLEADTTTRLYAGDTARVRIGARYLFGLPMAGGTAQWWWTVRERSSGPSIPGLEGYVVGRREWRVADESAYISPPHFEGQDTLAADGSFTLRIATPALSRPGELHVNVTVSDANRQTVTSQLMIPLHAAKAYIGMRARERRWVWRVRDTVDAEILVVRPDGTPRVGDQITVAAQRDRWINNRVVRDTVWQATFTSGAAPVRARFLPRAAGSYELLASVVDEQGRRALTGLDVWVTGGSDTWAQRNPRDITLRSDKTSYAPGDKVSLVIESPGNQRGWVTLRREGLLHEQFVDLHAGANEVQVPVPVSAAPGAEIRVMVVRPYGSRGEDSAGIYFRSGTLSIVVDPTAHALRVAVAPDRKRYRPGDTVRINVNVRDAAGKARRAEASVWAVDEGVVSLTDYQRPALLSMLLAGGGDYAWASSTLIAWMLSVPPAVGPAYVTIAYGSMATSGSAMIRGRAAGVSLDQLSIPEHAGAEPNAIRSAFATTPFYSGAVRTDANGRATVAFKLPDNVTTFRLYAAAVGDETYAGSGDTSIVSTRPLIVRAALPRIVRIGDTLFAGAVITQEATSRTPVSLNLATRNIRVSGRGTLQDTLEGQRARELRYSMSVTRGDSVAFVFSATASGASPANDAVEVRLPVSPPGRARAHVVTGMVERTETVSLAIPDGTDTVRSRVHLQLGLSALPLVRQFSEALRIYPYYCTEQVSSAGRALIARIALQRALGDSTALTARDRTQLETGVSVLIGRQREDGGFGYWSESSWSTPWLTAYAMEFLVGARDAGILVPEGSVERGRKYLASYFPLQLRTGDDPWHAWRDSVAWPHNAMAVANTLRRAGVADTLLERDLWALRSKLGFEDRLSLAAVYAARSAVAKSRELVDEAWRSARLEGRRVTLDDSAASRTWLFRSVSRPMALLLATTARLQPKHPLLGALFESLVQAGSSEGSRWWNTLDQAAVAEALTAATSAMDLSRARTVAVSGPRGAIKTVYVEPRHVDSIPLSLPSLIVREKNGTALQLNLTSNLLAPTYYAMTLFEIPTARPVRADDAGISLERWYESYDGGKPITEVREGELVRVRLRITVPADREFVVIDDALPAGLEAVDLSLRTSASLPPFEGAPRLLGDMNEGPPGQRWLYGSWDAGWWTPWEHKEIRDDRVLYFARQLWKGSYQASYVARATTAGTFVRPPAQAEEMYNPAVRGRSDGGTFTVTRAPK